MLLPDEHPYNVCKVFKPKKTYRKFKGARLVCFLMKTIVMDIMCLNQKKYWKLKGARLVCFLMKTIIMDIMCLNQKNLLEVERGSPCVFPDENHYNGYNVF